MSVDAEALRASIDMSKVDRFVARRVLQRRVDSRGWPTAWTSGLRETRSKGGGAFEIVRRLRLLW
jgi:hypothetical protein